MGLGGPLMVAKYIVAAWIIAGRHRGESDEAFSISARALRTLREGDIKAAALHGWDCWERVFK